VLLVALSHARVSFLAGGYVGVDVFFVLSGYLITGLLLSGASNGRASIVDFYARRAKRILPAATLTLIVTDVVAFRLLNFVRAKQTITDSITAAFFFANIHFAHIGTDYFAASQPPSPVQQFWSLSVEEQFYVIWPLVSLTLLGVTLRSASRSYLKPSLARLGVASAAVARRISAAGARRVWFGVAAIGLLSLAWSIYYTHSQPAAAYFSTLARAWELALGAALAIAAGRVALVPDMTRAVGGWLGLLCIGVAAVTFSSSTPFPGYAALLPTLGAALVIAAGIVPSEVRWSAGRMLAVGPMRYVGDRSYAFYLWHWPALTIAALYARHSLSVGTNLLLLLLAFGVSVITYRYFENPLRHTRWRPTARGLVLWPLTLIPCYLVAGLLLTSLEATETRVAVAAMRPDPGLLSPEQRAAEAARAARAEAVNVAATRAGTALPAVRAAAEASQRGDSIPQGLSPPLGNLLNAHFFFKEGCAPEEDQTESRICRLGDPSGRASIAVLGDSHAEMWMPAVLGVAQREHWAVLPIVHSGCTPYSWSGAQGKATCVAWYRWALREAESLHPTIMLVTGAYSGDGAEAVATSINTLASFAATMKPFAGHVVVITDPPGETEQPLDCLLATGATMGTCSSTQTGAQAGANEELALLAHNHGAGLIETTGWFCFNSRCPMVIGHTIAYSDGGHVTTTYAEELTGPFKAALTQAVAQTH